LRMIMANRSKTALLSVLLLASSTVAFVACHPAADDPGIARLDSTPAPADAWFAGLPMQEAQRAVLCGRNNQDQFATWYCAGATAPKITRLEDLLVGLKLKDPANPFSMQFAMNSNSMSLVGRNTSVLNPRVIIFTPVPFINGTPATPDAAGAIPAPEPTASTNTSGYLALGFARGSHLVEIASFDPAKQDINFYLVRYGKSCDPSCPNSELFTPATERDWTSVTVYGDPDIRNTPLDCLSCHQPAGTGTKRILRMQERQFPWTHWFFAQFEGGGPTPEGGTNGGSSGGVAADVAPGPGPGQFVDLAAEFMAAHPNEEYGGVPANMITSSFPPGLEQFVEANGFADQPNEFNGSAIESEGRGPTWLSIYGNATAGFAISVPSYKVDPSDPLLLSLATQRYLDAAQGKPAVVPNMSALYPDRDFGDLGFRASDSAKTGTDVVRHRCGTCHSGKFPGISKNNFDVRQFPNGLSATERALVLDRIRLDDSNPRRMPPAQFSDLTEAQKRMIETSLGAR
ncbi:MAG TPA: hypothetical protein VMV18_09885, partial [bacterium]|nr:hypothetical protein [bacterium]